MEGPSKSEWSWVEVNGLTTIVDSPNESKDKRGRSINVKVGVSEVSRLKVDGPEI